MQLSILQKSYMLVPLAVLLSMAVVFVLNLVSKQKDEEKVYSKAAMVGAIVAGLIVYIHNLHPSLEEIISTPVPF